MIDIGTLSGTLSLQDAFTGVLTHASRSLKGFKDEFTATMRKAATENATFAKSMEKTGQSLQKAGQTLVGVSLAAGAAIAGVVKTTSDFESSFAGVRKTVNGSEADLQALSDGFRKMATEIPVSVNELNNIGAAAGQLGIHKENILGFTRVMADLGVATNLSSEEAASSLAKFANITRMSQTDFDKLGSTIVALGNNFATTEADIVSMAMRIAGAGAQIGLTEPQILALGTSLSSVGIEAEAGGSAISKVMIDMALAVSQGGEALKQFSAVAGADFASKFKTDAAGALNDFIVGLGQMKERGDDVLGTLEEMGIKEVRMRDALLRASGAGDLLTRSLELSGKAWRDNSALTKESEERYKTFASQVTILWNKVKEASIEIGLSLMPTMKAMVEGTGNMLGVLDKMAKAFADLPEPVRIALASVVAFVAVLAPLLLLAGKVAAAISFIAEAGVTGAMILAFGKVILVVGAVTAVLYGLYKIVTEIGRQTGIFDALGKAWEMIKEKARAVWAIVAEPVWKALSDALYQVGAAFGEVWKLIVDMLTPTGDLNDYLKTFKVIVDIAGVGAQMFANVLIDIAKVVQNFAWGVKEAVGYVRSLINAWEVWTGKDTKLEVPGAPGASTQGFSLPKMDFEAAIAAGNASTAKLEQSLTAGARRAGEISDATKKALKAQQDAVEAAAKAAGDAYASLINVDAVESANEMAEAFRTAQSAGVSLAKETLVDVADAMHAGIVATAQMGEEVPQAFYDIRDAARAASFDIKDFAGKIGIDGIEMMQKMRESVDEATTSYKEMSDEIQDAQWANIVARQTTELSKTIAQIGADYDKAMRRFRDGRPLGEAGKQWDLLAKEIETGYVEQMDEAVLQTGAMQTALLAVAAINPGFLGFLHDALPEIKNDAKEAAKDFQSWEESLGGLAGAFRDLAQTTDGAMGSFATVMGEIVGSMQLGSKAGESMFSGFNQMNAGGWKNMAAGAAQMAAGIMSAVAALNAATQSTSRLRNAMGGAASGASIGAAFGPWGALAGGVIGGIYGAFKNTNKSPDPMAEHQARVAEFHRQQVEKLTAAYQELHTETNNTFSELLGKAQALGIKLPAALIASIKETVVLNQLTKENKELLEEMANAAEVDWRKMQEAAERYGIPLEALGRQFQQLRLNDAAQAIINDFDILQRGGADVGTILFGMKEEISKLVTEALKFGTTIPENMKPWIDELMRAGLLVDENGEKLTDLTGLKFGEPIQTEFEKITLAIEELVRVIREDLINALNAIPRNVDVNVNTNVNDSNSNPNPAGGGGGNYPGTYTPNGGDYTVGSVDSANDYRTQGQSSGVASGPTNVTLVVKNHQVFTEIVNEGMDEKVGMLGYR